MKLRKSLIAAAIATLVVAQASAAPTAEEIAELGKGLTPLGAIKAGNAEGTIPAWEGGLCSAPAGYKPIDRRGGYPYVDPFANEKPLFTITAANMGEYADKLAEGTKELLKRNPESYRLDVYPTHRTACFPDWVYQNTIENVGKAKLVGDAPGLADSHAAFPFPIPKTGAEAMWNFMVKFHGAYLGGGNTTYLIDTSGNVTLTAANENQEYRAHWDRNLTNSDDKPFWAIVARQFQPASAAGSVNLLVKYPRMDQTEPRAWNYIPGQRRVRMAPEFKYDTVSATSGGILMFDEINGFDGSMDKYDWKLVGRREMYVPYNVYKRYNMPVEQTLMKNHENPDTMRWELHRVWEVEANLKEGQRHVHKVKRFYIDEDSWSILAYEGFDHQGSIHKYMVFPVNQEYEKPLLRQGWYDIYDFNRRNWAVNVPGGINKGGSYLIDPLPANHFSPGAIAGRGVR